MMGIKAIQYSRLSHRIDIEEFLGQKVYYVLESESAYVAGKGPPIFSCVINTVFGQRNVFHGEWIIKDVDSNGQSHVLIYSKKFNGEVRIIII